MRTRTMMLTVVLCLLQACFAWPRTRTWEPGSSTRRSRRSPPAHPRTRQSRTKRAGDKIKVTVDGVDGEASPRTTSGRACFDGKDYPVTGDSASDMRSYKEANGPHA